MLERKGDLLVAVKHVIRITVQISFIMVPRSNVCTGTEAVLTMFA